MSSNAPQKARPMKARTKGAARTQSCDHPRFLKLVNELTRISDAKEKQDEAESECSAPNCAGLGQACASDLLQPDQIPANASDAIPPQHQLLPLPLAAPTVAANLAPVPSNRNSYNRTDLGPSRHPSGCCCIGGQAPNGYGLEGNLPSTLHDNQYHLHNSHQPQQRYHHLSHHGGHQNLYPPQPHHHNHDSMNRNLDLPHYPNLGSNNLHQHQVDRCPGKGAPASNLGFPKQGLAEQNNSDFSNNSDLRQDENRSKRKRPSHEAVSMKKSSCSSSGSSKRHKSSPDSIRPLSPSFTKCPICLLDSMDRDPSFTNTCFHLFCFSCIDNWTKNKATCPLCRTKFTKIIYNIKSATSYDEKNASPIKRDDDDGYIPERYLIGNVSTSNTNSAVSSRAPANESLQFLFDHQAIGMHQYLPPQLTHRQDEAAMAPFIAVPATNNFNSTVPQILPVPTGFHTTGPNLFSFPYRNPPTASTAIASAYTNNPGLMTDAGHPRRVHRNLRANLTRNFADALQVPSDGSTRTSRGPMISTMITPSTTTDRNHHHHHHNHHHNLHPPHHQAAHHQSQHHSQLLRSINDLGSRSNLRIEQSHAHLTQSPYQYPRNYSTSYTRRLPASSVVDNQLIESLYVRDPDM